jgi:putative acetyltransferase
VSITRDDVVIRLAELPADFAKARELIREYADWLAVDLAFQNHDTELAEIETYYGPPDGCLNLATVSGEAAGCMAVHALNAPGEGELKRLYVRPAYRGLGIGRALFERTISAARGIGYRCLRFDTWPERMPEIQAMYRRFGCIETPPYYDNPVKGVIFMKLDLDGQ